MPMPKRMYMGKHLLELTSKGLGLRAPLANGGGILWPHANFFKRAVIFQILNNQVGPLQSFQFWVGVRA